MADAKQFINSNKLKALLDRYGKEVVKEIQTTLIQNKKVATGSLVKSFKYQVVEKNNILDLKISTDSSYALIIDKGKKASNKQAPVEPFLKWIKAKGLSKGAQRDLSFAYALSKKVNKKSVKGLNFMAKSLNKVKSKLSKEISQQLKQSAQEAVYLELNTALTSQLKIKI